MNKRIAVVILNWNGKKFLEDFLPGVIRHSRDMARIIVADNASTDDSLALLRDRFPEVEVIPMDQNTGFAGGYNEALRQVKSEFYVLLNSDIEVTEGWLEPLLNCMDDHRNAGACQPKIRDFYRRDKFEYAGAAGGYLDWLGYPYCRGRIFNILEKDNGQYNDTRQVFWATGACLFVRSETYHSIGGLDDRFFAHMEEIDLCWRIQRSGQTVFVVPGSTVYHVGGGTLPKSNSRKTFLNFRNNLLMLSNNLKPSEFRRIYLYRFVLDLLAAVSFLVTSGAADFVAVLKAHRDFRRVRRQAGPNPSVPLKTASIKTFQGTGRSILFHYYLCGRKTFSSLPPFISK